MTDSARPVVSVLVPCWNAAASIERALDSVLEERGFPLECVVVDDGSTDRTLDVVRAVAAREPRVVVIAMGENRGVSNARNEGLKVVRGDWLTLLDADDRFLPDGLQMLTAAALGGDAAAVIGQQIWWDGRRRWRTPGYNLADIRRPGRKSLVSNPGLLNYVSPHAKLLHRDTWHGLGFSGRVLGDQPWIIRALLRAGDRIEVLGETVYEWYRPGPTVASGSITATTRSTVTRGVEAVGVAGDALASVREEAARLLDERGRDVVGRHYADRLVRSDLAAHVARALDRGDPEIGLLFDAIGTFVTTLPAGYVPASTALARSIVEPPLRRWYRVRADGRMAYWRLFETSLRADPELPDKGASPLARVGLRLAAASPGRRGAAATLLMLTRVLGGVRRRLPVGVRPQKADIPG